MAKSAFAKPWLKSAGHEELYFRLCTGTVTVMFWVPFMLSKLLSIISTSKLTLLPQKHSFSSITLQPKTTLGSGYPSLHFFVTSWPDRAVLQAPTQVWDPREAPLGSPALRERHVGPGPGSLRHHSTGLSAPVPWAQMLPGISPLTHALKLHRDVGGKHLS